MATGADSGSTGEMSPILFVTEQTYIGKNLIFCSPAPEGQGLDCTQSVDVKSILMIVWRKKINCSFRCKNEEN